MKEADFVDWMHDEHGPRTSGLSERSRPATESSGHPASSGVVHASHGAIHWVLFGGSGIDRTLKATVIGFITVITGRETFGTGSEDALAGPLIVSLGGAYLLRGGVVTVLAGGTAGAILGGALFWWIGMVAMTAPAGSLVGAVAFIISFIAFVGSWVTPLTIGLVLRSTVASAMNRELVTVGAYSLMVIGVLAFALAGLSVPVEIGIDTASEAIAFLDGIFGFVIGGIAGAKIAVRFVE